MTKNSEVIPRVSGFIDKDTEMVGDLRFKDAFRIDGKFKGNILSGNSLIIGECGEVEATVDVNSISINGRVKGEFRAKEKIEIFAKGRISGSLMTPKLQIEEGAFFQGSCQMEQKMLEGANKESAFKPNK